MKLSHFLYFAGFGAKTILFKKKSPILGTVILTDKCNLSCKHCSVNNITAVIHPYEQVKREMKQLYDMGVRILFFCGGETFMWEDSGKLSACGRCIDIPGLCEKCGYFFVAEYSLLFGGNLKIMAEMLKTYLKYI